jgi:hypothetical protein
MNKLQQQVIKTQYKPNCFVLASFSQRDIKETQGDFMVKTTISFLFDAGEYAAEWEPEYGPIQVWHKCTADAPNAREHYYFDFTDSKPGNCSQCAVDDNAMPQATNRGDFDHVFAVLKKWANR